MAAVSGASPPNGTSSSTITTTDGVSISTSSGATTIGVSQSITSEKVNGTSSPSLTRKPSKAPIPKRIILCCDGTWEDGLSDKNRNTYSNITRLSRAINQYDTSGEEPIHQVIFYQSGVGSVDNWYSKYVEGVFGSTLGAKMEEVYGFLCLNYNMGDEIFLFGFSRGAYIARMVAMLIGVVGILDQSELDAFPQILSAYQTLKKSNGDEEKNKQQRQFLSTWTDPNSPSQKRARMAGGDSAYSIKCVGVFDTVGTKGFPDELHIMASKKDIEQHSTEKTLFGFPDCILGEHIERAYHAVAINEVRLDFAPCLFEQSETGRAKGQILRQCWFAGEHGDIGGGCEMHDLTDLTLFWMVSNLMDMISINMQFLRSIPAPNAPWGELVPYNALQGASALSVTVPRRLPTETNEVTHETIHSSVTHQKNEREDLLHNLQENPALICPLLEFEQEMKDTWPYVPNGRVVTQAMRL